MDLDTLLHDTAPVPEPSERLLEAGRIVLAAAVPTAVELRVRRRRRVRRLAVAAVATAAAAALIVMPTISLDHRTPAGTADAAVVLRLAAQAAGEQPGGWPDSSYWHSLSHYSRQGSPPVRREVWIGHHQRGALIDPGVIPDVVIPLSVGQFIAATYMDWDGLYALPTDARELEAVLRRGRPADEAKSTEYLLNTVAGLLRESPASPALRRALYEVVANAPGIEYAGSVSDADGRTGAAVKSGEMELIIDTADGRLLQQSEGQGALITTYEAQGPAETAPAATAGAHR